MYLVTKKSTKNIMVNYLRRVSITDFFDILASLMATVNCRLFNKKAALARGFSFFVGSVITRGCVVMIDVVSCKVICFKG